jgi:mono/diheme cytochrome c family protein
VAKRRVLLAFVATLAFATPAFADTPLPPPAAGKVDFAAQIKSLLEKNCLQCHSRGKLRGGLSLETRDNLLRGGETGPAAVVGKSADSLLIRLVTGQEPDRVMPQKGEKLTAEQIGLLRAWIDQGLPFPEGFSFGFRKASLAPRRPALPPATDTAHPIDRLLRPYFERHGVHPGKVVSDRLFARRVSLDLVGLLPSPEELDTFVADHLPEKRRLLVEKLLAERTAYAEHWMTFWNDLLRNAYKGTGFIDGGRKPITEWLYAALRGNKPYDRFVHELVAAAPGAEGFTKGIVWRGVVNASQAPPVQAAQGVTQVFLGTNLKCASCHDSFVNHWRLTDAYGLASVFSDGPLELNRCDKPTGKTVAPCAPYPELGAIAADKPREERMRQLADLLTKPEDGRLARTVVNRLWAQLFGRGIVEPVDDLDQEPWSADLLDWLATDLADHGYDLKRTLTLICTSRAYQLPAVGSADPKAAFAGPLVKRMTAEQFVDAVATLTDVWPDKPAVYLPGDAEPLFDSGVMRSGAKTVDVDVTGLPLLRLTVTDADDGIASDWADWGEPVIEGPKGTRKLTELKWVMATTGYGKVQVNHNVVGKPLRIDGKDVGWGVGTHARSEIVYRLPAGTTRFRATVGPDTGALEQKDAKTSVRFLVTAEAKNRLRVRASLLNDDELTRALGRPNREQVVTKRDSLATLLQALELTNGKTLDAALKAGAEHLLKAGGDTDAVIGRVYHTALGRAPTAAELDVARGLVGAPAKAEGVADLLWAVLMLPEFQIIY